MRPKTVILTLVVAIGLVALAAVLKRVMGGGASSEVKPPDAELVGSATPAVTNVKVGPPSPNASNTAAIREQLRAEELMRELDQIREVQADGVVSPTAIGILLSKVTHQESDVRRAAIEALVQLRATNAIPGLEQALAVVEDPRDKVVIMDAIAYLKLPEDVPSPTGETADSVTNMPPRSTLQTEGQKANPRTPGQRAPRGAQNRPRRAPAPPTATDTQPASPAPASATPQ
jgi:hypothetical protein